VEVILDGCIFASKLTDSGSGEIVKLERGGHAVIYTLKNLEGKDKFHKDDFSPIAEIINETSGFIVSYKS